jgi:hypothetical protein
VTTASVTPVLCPRRARLLAVIVRTGGEWTTARAWLLYRRTGLARRRADARHDLQYLAALGLLVKREQPGRTTYQLAKGVVR